MYDNAEMYRRNGPEYTAGRDSKWMTRALSRTQLASI
jgi:hypothetical protein